MVIIGFTAATLQLSLLVRKYLQFQVVELSEIKDSMPVEFPSVTVCNIEPISWRKIRLLFQNPEDTELMQWLNFTNRSACVCVCVCVCARAIVCVRVCVCVCVC